LATERDPLACGDGPNSTDPGAVYGSLSSMDSSTTSEKVRENRLHRMADRQGLRLVKSARRDPRALDYDGCMLVDLQTNGVVAGTEGVGRPRWTLDDVERYLTGDPR
jgi:hypothetical protein